MSGDLSEESETGTDIHRNGSVKRRLSTRFNHRGGRDREKKPKNGDNGPYRSSIDNDGISKDDIEMIPESVGDDDSGMEMDNKHRDAQLSESSLGENEYENEKPKTNLATSSLDLPNIGSIYLRRAGSRSSPINLNSTPIPTPFLTLSSDEMHSSKSPVASPSWNAANHSSSSESTSTPRINIHTKSNRVLSTSAPSRLSPPPSFNLSSGQPLVHPPLKTQAAFVGKLYTMLEDEDIAKTGLIHWSPDGTIFTCPDPTEFSKIVLPKFFKHNNWQSFVRQLNMYSFSKFNDIYSAAADPQAWEFRHPSFRRGAPHLLASIKRKSTKPSGYDGPALSSPVDEQVDPIRQVAGWMHRGSASGTLSPPILRDNTEPVYGHDPYIEPRQPTRTGYWNTSSQHRPPQPFGTTPSVGRDAQDLQPPRTATRYAGSTQSEGHRSRTPQLEYSSEMFSRVGMLEEKLHRLNETINAERLIHARATVEMTNQLSMVVGWVAAGISPGEDELQMLQESLHRSSSESRQRYETLIASDALTSLAGRDARRNGAQSIQQSQFHSSLVPIPSDPPTHLRINTRPSTLPSTQPTPIVSPISNTFPPPDIYRPTSRHHLSYLHSSELSSSPSGGQTTPYNDHEDDEGVGVFKKPKVDSEPTQAKTGLANLLN